MPAPAPAPGSFLPPGSPLGNPNLDTLARNDTPPPAPAPAPSNPRDTAQGQPLFTQAGDGSGFRVVVVPGSGPLGTGGLQLNRGVSDQVVTPVAGTPVQITIPADAFAHTNPDAVVALSARLASGEALPPWLSFDPASGKFTVRGAPGERRTVEVRVEASDGQRVVVTTFKVTVGGTSPRGSVQRGALLEPAGRPGLTAQLRLAAQRQALPAERLDRLGALLAQRPAAERAPARAAVQEVEG